MIREDVATALIDTAHRLDAYLSHPCRMKVHTLYGLAKRDLNSPTHVEMSLAEQTLASEHGWYINQNDLNLFSPDRFTALDGSVVCKGPKGYINPYGPTGLTGPGVLGFGVTPEKKPIPESRAVDVVIQFIDPVTDELRFIGGIRSDTGQPCFVGGFQEKGALSTAAREFIEEAISGSIDLKIHAPRLFDLCLVKQRGEGLSLDENNYLKSFCIDPKKFSGDVGETIYRFIEREDPQFLNDLINYFKEDLTIAYQGACRADPRNTDNRWIASTVLTGIIDLNRINDLLSQQKYPYRFAAGSDLRDINFHTVGQKFLTNAFASHGPLLGIATAHNLRKLSEVSINIIDQCLKYIENMNDMVCDNICLAGHPTSLIHSKSAPTKMSEPML